MSETEFEDVNTILAYKLSAEFNKINRDNVDYHLGKQLSTPNFDVHSAKSMWGLWDPSTRTISMNIDLIRNYEWNAVVYVLKHEMAHMIVHEIFNMGDCKSHGNAFERACKVVDCEFSSCAF